MQCLSSWGRGALSWSEPSLLRTLLEKEESPCCRESTVSRPAGPLGGSGGWRQATAYVTPAPCGEPQVLVQILPLAHPETLEAHIVSLVRCHLQALINCSIFISSWWVPATSAPQPRPCTPKTGIQRQTQAVIYLGFVLPRAGVWPKNRCRRALAGPLPSSHSKGEENTRPGWRSDLFGENGASTPAPRVSR